MTRFRVFYVPLVMAALSTILSSCSMYKQDFDCPPPEGVPCYSETELESMIMETKDGCPDLFIPPEKDNNSCVKSFTNGCPALNRKVWICDQSSDCGSYTQGRYFYKSKLSNTPDIDSLELISTYPYFFPSIEEEPNKS